MKIYKKPSSVNATNSKSESSPFAEGFAQGVKGGFDAKRDMMARKNLPIISTK